MSLLLKHDTETMWAAGLSIAEVRLTNKPVNVSIQPTEQNTILKQQSTLMNTYLILALQSTFIIKYGSI